MMNSKSTSNVRRSIEPITTPRERVVDAHPASTTIHPCTARMDARGARSARGARYGVTGVVLSHFVARIVDRHGTHRAD